MQGKPRERPPTSVLPDDSLHIAHLYTLPGPHGRSLLLSLSHVRIYAALSGPRLRKLAYMPHVVWVKPPPPGATTPGLPGAAAAREPTRPAVAPR
jgi:hypothetical protein